MINFLAPMFDKKAILRLSLAKEREAAAEARPDAKVHAARTFLDAIPLRPEDRIAVYHPIKTELDPAPLTQELRARSHAVGLPVVTGKKRPLTFRTYEEGAALIRGAYGVQEPAETAPLFEPTIILTPLLAFDSRGGRLGYGGGFYDRTLAEIRARRDILAVGYAYGAQEVDAVPLSRLDQPLDWIVTERGAIRAA